MLFSFHNFSLVALVFINANFKTYKLMLGNKMPNNKSNLDLTEINI